LTTGGIAQERWVIHPNDPTSAVGETSWTQTLRRGDWSVRTVATTRMWSDATHFHMRARIEAFEGRTLLYARDEESQIIRKCL